MTLDNVCEADTVPAYEVCSNTIILQPGLDCVSLVKHCEWYSLNYVITPRVYGKMKRESIHAMFLGPNGSAKPDWPSAISLVITVITVVEVA